MTQPANQSPAENQTEKIIDSLKYEIESLKSQLKKKGRPDRHSGHHPKANIGKPQCGGASLRGFGRQDGRCDRYA